MTMSEYIEREAAVKALQEKVFTNYTDEFYGAMQALNEIPAANVAPVAHGRWIKDNDSWQPDDYYCCYFDHKCSECGNVVNDRYGLPNYCPNCGAKMDGGAE